MKRAWIGGLLAAIPSGAAWAHSGAGPHVHPDELMSLIAMFLALVALAAFRGDRRRGG